MQFLMSWAVFLESDLAKILLRCFFTVKTLMKSFSAISALLNPSLMSFMMSIYLLENSFIS